MTKRMMNNRRVYKIDINEIPSRYDVLSYMEGVAHALRLVKEADEAERSKEYENACDSLDELARKRGWNDPAQNPVECDDK